MKKISVGKAILIGQLVVSLPVLIIFLVICALGEILIIRHFITLPLLEVWVLFLGLLAPAFIGGAVAWLWWSFSVPRWRRWALQNGAPEDKLQKWAVITGLVFRKGSIFERTEFRLKE